MFQNPGRHGFPNPGRLLLAQDTALKPYTLLSQPIAHRHITALSNANDPCGGQVRGLG